MGHQVGGGGNAARAQIDTASRAPALQSKVAHSRIDTRPRHAHAFFQNDSVRTSPSDAPTLRRAPPPVQTDRQTDNLVQLPMPGESSSSPSVSASTSASPAGVRSRTFRSSRLVELGLGLGSGLGLGIGLGLEEGPVVAPLLARLGGGGEAHVLLRVRVRVRFGFGFGLGLGVGGGEGGGEAHVL